MDVALSQEAPKERHGRSLMFKLELRFQNLIVREYRFEDGDLRAVGRDPANHIVIDDRTVSRNHACLVCLKNKLFIWDEGSKHGTVVNGIPVICAQLQDGDLVSIGASHNLRAFISTKEQEETSTAILDGWHPLGSTM
jgi:pSer/pThr/pTyr-binding forkhead associated (FHA) protein